MCDQADRPRWNVLFIEDNDDDAFIVERAFRTAEVDSRLTRIKDGRAAMAYLQSKAPYDDPAASPFPHLVLLDLKIPLHSGLELLRWMRLQEGLKSQIVVVLSSSAENRDLREAYQLHANAFLVKPSTLTEMVKLAQCIQTCWLNQFSALFERSPGAALN